MTNTAKHKGDRAEREVADLIATELGVPCRRKLGAGRFDDCGDIDGVPETVIQVADYTDPLRAIREKVPASEQQQLNAGATFGASFIRFRGGMYRVVLSVPQWGTYAREAMR